MKDFTYRDLVSGEKRGSLANAARCGLHVLSYLYAAGAGLRNSAFDRGLCTTHRAGAPVVSVGNLTVGGTGKTPIVAAIARWFISHGVKPVVLSRGYRAVDGANDEKLVLDQLCPGVVHLQGADRVTSADEACRLHRAQVLILDDGFQHRRLARDLDIVLIDAIDPWGAGHLLPRGLLREPRASLRRANLVILTRANQCMVATKQAVIVEVAARCRGSHPIEAVFQPVGFMNAGRNRRAVGSVNGPVAAFCGIGNPLGFRRTLGRCGLEPAGDAFRVFPDHHVYTAADLADLADWAHRCKASAIVATQKDLVKIPRNELGGIPFWALCIEAEFVAGRERLEESLEQVACLAPKNATSGRA